MTVLKPARYANLKGQCCPVCRSKQITGHSIEIDTDCASQEITCNNCGSSWNDVYKLIGYSDLETEEVQYEPDRNG